MKLVLQKTGSARLLLALCGLLSASSATAQKSFAGTYLLWQETVSTTELPVLKDVVATTQAVAVVQISQHGADLQIEGQLCSLHLSSTSSLVHTSFPPAFMKALPPIDLQGSIEERRGVPYLVTRAKTLVLGAQLARPQLDPLPKEASHPRVFDQDRDGHPGMTVHVSGLINGEVYVVQRSSTQLSGPATQDGFRGGIHFELEQNVVGASKQLLKNGPDPRPDSSRSQFALVRWTTPLACDVAEVFARRWHR